MGWRDRLMRQVRAWWRESDSAPGWCLRVSQAPDETVEQAVARTARAQGLPPQAVLGALVLGFPESDQMRDWPRLFEWRRPGYQGPLRGLRGYRQARIEMMKLLRPCAARRRLQKSSTKEQYSIPRHLVTLNA